MNITRILEQTTDFYQRHGWNVPIKAEVSEETARRLVNAAVLTNVEPNGRFGRETLGVTEWFVNRDVPDGELRLSVLESLNGAGE